MQRESAPVQKGSRGAGSLVAGEGGFGILQAGGGGGVGYIVMSYKGVHCNLLSFPIPQSFLKNNHKRC